jgi:hypothetical protein
VLLVGQEALDRLGVEDLLLPVADVDGLDQVVQREAAHRDGPTFGVELADRGDLLLVAILVGAHAQLAGDREPVVGALRIEPDAALDPVAGGPELDLPFRVVHAAQADDELEPRDGIVGLRGQLLLDLAEGPFVRADPPQLLHELRRRAVAGQALPQRSVGLHEDEGGQPGHAVARGERLAVLALRVDRQAHEVARLGDDDGILERFAVEALAPAAPAGPEVDEDDLLLRLRLLEGLGEGPAEPVEPSVVAGPEGTCERGRRGHEQRQDSLHEPHRPRL